MSRASRYDRQMLFWPRREEDQARLAAARILVVGCGALGSRSAEDLARSGVGFLRLVDRDVVEWSNLHRQSGYEEADAERGALKAEALAGRIARVNSTVRVEAAARELNAGTALFLASGVDLIVDGTDNLPTRFLLNDLSYSLGIPWIYAGAVAATAHVQLFSGREGPCLRCQMPELPPPGTLATCDTAGVIGPAAGAAASWQAALALRYLTEGSTRGLSGKKALLEPWDLRARVVEVARDPECQVCALRQFDALRGDTGERATALCGREAVQVLPAGGGSGHLDLEALGARLASHGTLEARPRFLRLRSTDGIVMTVFEDGRAIFDGLTDPSRARSLYVRLVGQ